MSADSGGALPLVRSSVDGVKQPADMSARRGSDHGIEFELGFLLDLGP